MQVVFHIGAHCTDEDRLLKSLLKNREPLSRRGISVPGPGQYRKQIRQALKSMDGTPPTQEIIDELHKTVISDNSTKRLLLSHENFLTFIPQIFAGKQLYKHAQLRLPALAALFPGADIEFHLGIRNPASFIPAVFNQTRNMLFADFMFRMALRDIKWSNLVHSIRTVCPDAKLTVWCNEDAPMIWSDLLHSLAGNETGLDLDGQDDLLAEIMQPYGLRRYYSYLESHPPANTLQKRRIISAFLDKFAIEDQLEDEVDIAGWTQDLVDKLTDIYEADICKIKTISGVEFIQA
jgi:hypothetical protein